MTTHHTKRRLAIVAAALLACSAAPATAQAEVCEQPGTIGAGLGTNAFFLKSCSRFVSGGRQAYAQFFSGATSTRASACKIWIRPERYDAQFFDCTPMLRAGSWRTYKYTLWPVVRTRTQSCYLLRYGTGSWTRSYCVWSG